MPLPSVSIYGAKQCEVKSKRTGLPCKNPAAYGCIACKMHGAHKSKNTPKGASHPQYRHGNATNETKLLRSKKSAQLLYIRDLGDNFGVFEGGHTKGRKPHVYAKLNLSDPQQMELAIKLALDLVESP